MFTRIDCEWCVRVRIGCSLKLVSICSTGWWTRLLAAAAVAAAAADVRVSVMCGETMALRCIRPNEWHVSSVNRSTCARSGARITYKYNQTECQPIHSIILTQSKHIARPIQAFKTLTLWFPYSHQDSTSCRKPLVWISQHCVKFCLSREIPSLHTHPRKLQKDISVKTQREFKVKTKEIVTKEK